MVEEVSVDVVVSEEALEEEDMEEGSEGEDSEVNKVDSVTTNLGSFNLRPKSTSRT